MQSEHLKTLQYCQQKFQTILPNQDVKSDTDKFNHQERQILVQSHQIIQTFAHYQILIQLLIQNALLCKSDLIRRRTIKLIEQLEKPDRGDTQQHYFIDLAHFQANPESFTIECCPLSNNFQIPILKQWKQIVENNYNKNFDDKVNILKKYQPLIQESYIPQQFQQCSKVRCKFTPVDEDLLYQGLQKYGSKKLEWIQKEFLWDKSQKQIKNKYKNSICSNAQMNKIKQWKLNQYEYLTQKEVNQLIQGLNWFGKEKHVLIQRFFVPSRSADFINNELKKAEQLIKKRKKHNLNEQYPDYYEVMWNKDRKKTQLKSVQKEPLSNIEVYFNLNISQGFENSNNNSFFRSNREISAFLPTNNNNNNQQHKQLTFFPLLNVQILNLSHNKIHSIPHEIITLEKLNTLILNHNFIKTFPQCQLPSLKNLEIAHNKLIDSNLNNLQLTQLNIAHNDFEIYCHNKYLDRLTLSWFSCVDDCNFHNNLLTNPIGQKLRNIGNFTFTQFVHTFSEFTNQTLIKVIQYDESAVLFSLMKEYDDHLIQIINPQPLFLAAKLNMKMFTNLLNYVPNKNRLFILMLFWATYKLDLELVQLLLSKQIFGLWDEKLNYIQPKIGINLKCVVGDTPLHILFRKQCSSEFEYLIQQQLVILLSSVQNINHKNDLKQAPIHCIHQIRTFDFCEGFDFSKRCGPLKDTLLHLSAQEGNIANVIKLAHKVGVFAINQQNKTPKQKCSVSLSLLKYMRKLENEELRQLFRQKYNNLIVSSRSALPEFHIPINAEDDLYALLLNDMVLQDKLIIIVILSLLQFKQLYQVKFVSQRAIQPIQFINKCFFKFVPNLKQFQNTLHQILKQNLLTINTPPKNSLAQQKIKLSKSLIHNLEPIQCNNQSLYDLITLYSVLGLSYSGDSNRTVLLDYENFQQQQFHKSNFWRKCSKNYVVQQSPLPMKYTYDNFLTYRKSKSITDPGGLQTNDQQFIKQYEF